MKRYWMVKGTKMLVLFAGFVLLASVAVMLLWNALIPAIFDGAQITLIQALGLLILTRILVGASGRGFGMHRGRHWRKRWESKMEDMSAEDRKKWKEEVGRHMCWSGSDDLGDGQATEGGPVETKTEA